MLIEKPIAATQEEASDLIQAAEPAGASCRWATSSASTPPSASCCKVVANEEVVVLEARRHSPHADRANDVSVVLDLMIHDIDLVLELAGSPVVRLAAAGGRSSDGPIDYVNATLGFEQRRGGEPHGQQDGPPQDPQPQRPLPRQPGGDRFPQPQPAHPPPRP